MSYLDNGTSPEIQILQERQKSYMCNLLYSIFEINEIKIHISLL